MPFLDIHGGPSLLRLLKLSLSFFLKKIDIVYRIVATHACWWAADSFAAGWWAAGARTDAGRDP
jgi:hypothetical protein